MHKRQQPREIPLRAPYFAVEVAEHGRIDFRKPSAAQMPKLQKVVEAVDRDKLLAAAKANGGEITVAGDVLGAQGAVVGLFWAHRDFDLVAKPGDDLIAFGQEVFEELHEGGFDLIDITTMWVGCLDKLRETRVEVASVAQALGFTRARAAGSTGSSPSPDSTSSATASPSNE